MNEATQRTTGSLVVRFVEGDEMLAARYVLGTYAFRSTPPLPDKSEWMEMFRGRLPATYVVAYENGTPVAGAGATMMGQNVRGARLDAAGIWGVATAPGARRKGYARLLVSELLARCRESGRSLACLYPFRESFYERLGYVSFPLCRTARFATAALEPLIKRELGGEVTLGLWSENYQAYRQFLANLQPSIHGFAIFDHDDAMAAERNEHWLALAWVDGVPVGMLLYKLIPDETQHMALQAHNFYYSTSQGRYLLLQWIASHVDQAEWCELTLSPAEVPESWLPDLQVRGVTVERAPMGRVVDLAALDGLPVGRGSFKVSLSDPCCPWNEGAWQFESRDGALSVRRADRADYGLSIQALTALVYGTHDPADFALRGWGEPLAELQATLRGMFPHQTAYVHETF